MHSRLLALTVLMVMFWSGNHAQAAGRVFYDGFESGSVDAAWRSDGGSPFCSVVSTSLDGVTGAYAGSKMVRCAHGVEDSSVFDNLVLDTDNYTDELFLRTKVRVDQDMDKTTGSGKKILRWFVWDGVSTYHDLYEIIRQTNGLNNECHSQFNVTENTYWGDAVGDNTAVTSGWHEVEYYIKHSTGQIKVWHDGVLIRNESGLNFVGAQWSPFYLTSNFSDTHDATNHVYFDEFEVYSDAGTGATGTMAAGDIVQGGGGGSGGGPIVMFITQSTVVISTFLQLLFLGSYCWQRRASVVRAAVKYWRYAVELPTPKEMYWAYRYKVAVKRWQKRAPQMLDHRPMTTVEIPKVQERIER